MIHLTDITYINGERHPLDYDYRKREFASKDELESYRKYLEKRTGKKVFFTYKEKAI
jgi:hypothetical protein